jgi:hypothetical protein
MPRRKSETTIGNSMEGVMRARRHACMLVWARSAGAPDGNEVATTARAVRTACLIAALGAVGIGAQVAPGRADSPPKLQVDWSCEAAGRGSIVLGRNKAACLADETTAEDTLKENWSKYIAADKTQCVGMAKTGGPQSYVELLSCLEIMRDARNIRNADPLESDNEPVTTRSRNRR